MKCPKCGYLGFEDVERCRNCGYDFSLTSAVPLPDLTFRRDTKAITPLDDLSLIDGGSATPDNRMTDIGAELDRTFGRDERAPGRPAHALGVTMPRNVRNFWLTADVDGRAVDQVRLTDVVDDAVKLARDHHRTDALFRRDLVDGHARRRAEGERTGVTMRGHALHPEFHLGRRHAELVLQNAARPQRRGLLIFRHADTAAAQIGGLVDAGRAPHQNLGVEEFSRGEDR